MEMYQEMVLLNDYHFIYHLSLLSKDTVVVLSCVLCDSLEMELFYAWIHIHSVCKLKISLLLIAPVICPLCKSPDGVAKLCY